jgi:hypothetical protein
VADLTREALTAALNRTPRHKSAADTRAERHQPRITRTTCRAPHPLGSEPARRVVVNHDSPADQRLQTTPHVEVGNARQVRRRAQDSIVRHHAGYANADRSVSTQLSDKSGNAVQQRT